MVRNIVVNFSKDGVKYMDYCDELLNSKKLDINFLRNSLIKIQCLLKDVFFYESD